VSGHRRAGHSASRRGRALAVASIFSAVVVVAVIAVVAFALRGGAHRAQVASPHRTTAVPNTPMTVERSTRDYVPDACATLSDRVAAALVPGGEKTSMDPADQSDQQTDCVWGTYDSAHPRQLSVELRAIDASGRVSAITEAAQTLSAERVADRAGQSLPSSARVTADRDNLGVGEAGYAVYDVDSQDESGLALVNVRVANVLITVHFSGNDNSGNTSAGRPLSASAAIAGGIEAARDLAGQLGPQAR
jgi:hypothetical protein